MKYYIQGNAAEADKIKAAFESKGISVPDYRSCMDEDLIYFSLDSEVFAVTIKSLELFEENPNYQELELPKPHYDIANFYAGMPVLVRDKDNHDWNYVLFSHCSPKYSGYRFGAGSTVWRQCIPFEGNEHLVGTTEPCGKEYINW